MLLDPDAPGSGGRADRSIPRSLLHLSNGRTLAYAEAGSGLPLIAIHGTLMTLEDMWLGPVPALSEHFRVIAVDRPGHGHSVRQRGTDASPWRQAEIIREAVLALGLQRPVVLGHSFGGAVALAYAMSFPEEIAGCVALAPICFPELRLEHMLLGPRGLPLAGEGINGAAGATWDPVLLPLLWNAMFLPQVMPAGFADAFPFGLAGRPAQMLGEGEDAASLLPSLARSALGYAGCRTRVLILGGSADIVVNNLMHGAFAAALMPNARFEMLPGIGHMLHHVRPDAVASAAQSVLS